MEQSIKQKKSMAISALSLTNELVNRYRARITGSTQCLEAGHHIAEILKKYCDHVYIETFFLYPGSLWNVGKILSLSYLVSAILLVIGGKFIYASLAVCLIGLVYGVVHYIFFGRLFDRFFSKKEGCNISGTIEPKEKAKQQIFIVGHHDSPYVFSFLLNFQKIASIRLILSIFSYLIITVICIVYTSSQIITGETIQLNGTLLIIVVLGLFFVIPLYFLITRIPSPGAGDNLNASVIAIKIAEYFYHQKQNDKSLKNTRLIFLSTDGEEAGQRGAIAYANKHKDELLNIQTCILNIDSVFRLENLSVLTRDRNSTIALSYNMVKECRKIAHNLGYSIKELALPIGGGGTDAAAFAKIGIESTTIIGISTSLINDGLVYHTPNDTVDHIQPEAVEAVFDIAINYIIHTDTMAT
jgi:aminopeptidase YwaD